MGDEPRDEIPVSTTGEERALQLQCEDKPHPPEPTEIERGRRGLTLLRRVIFITVAVIGALFLLSAVVIANLLNWIASPLRFYTFVVLYGVAILYAILFRKILGAVALVAIILAADILSSITSALFAATFLVLYAGAFVYGLVSSQVSTGKAAPNSIETSSNESGRYSIRSRYEVIRRSIWGGLDRAEKMIQSRAGPAPLPVVLAMRLILLPIDVLVRWLVNILDAGIGDRGWLTIGSVIGGYLVVYSLVDAKRQLDENRAGLERNTFVTLVSSDNPASFVVGLKSFGPIQTMTATSEPRLFEPWAWWSLQAPPNRDFMHKWARSRFHFCSHATCAAEGDARIDLSDANLSGADLSDSDLSGADFRGTDLSRVNLSGANLSRAKLVGVEKWSRANLEHANMSDVDLSGADLELVDLPRANLSGANLSRTDLSTANLSGANLSGANLSTAKVVYISDSILLLIPRVYRAILIDASYDENTRFPDNFDPVAWGMKRVPTK